MNFGKLGTAVSLACLAVGCGSRSAEESNTSEIKRDSRDALTYVDTHDSYGHTGTVDKAAFGRYFQRVNGKKTVLLTFDCAWIDRANGEDILNALKRNGIKATFFISGPFVFKDYRKGSAGGIQDESLPLIKRIIEEGHDIGNHTSTHPHNADRPNWTWEVTDLKKGWDMVLNRLYGTNAPANAIMKPFWRAPYGEYDASSLTTAARAGYPYHFGWNVDVRDTIGVKDCRVERTSDCLDSGKLTDYVLKFAEKNNYDLDAFVVLAHLSNYYMWGKYNDGLDRLATTLRSKGYEFARLAQSFRFDSTANGGSTGGNTGGGSTGGGESLAPGAIECPSGYVLKTVGTQGGRYCEDTEGKTVFGPFTEAMKAKCQQWGGGTGCSNNNWAKNMALNARGTALCPTGATFDGTTGYCAEGSNAFGPFPAALVKKCQTAGGGESCKSARWGTTFLRSLLGRS